MYYYFYSHYQQVESGTHGDEGQGGTADDSQGTKESEDEKGADVKRQRSSSKDKKGVWERRPGKERERVRGRGREREREERERERKRGRGREKEYAYMHTSVPM